MSNRLVIGPAGAPILELDAGHIESCSGQASVDIISDGLSIDTLDPELRHSWIVPAIYKPTDAGGILTSDGSIYCSHFEGMDLVRNIPWGTSLQFWRGSALRGRYYVDKVEHLSGSLWRISAMSLVGILDKQEHKGRVYTGQSWAAVLQEIMGSSALGAAGEGGLTYWLYSGLEDYKVESSLALTKVYGWLPYASARSNLHQLLFSAGASMVRDENANLIFKFLTAAEPAAIEAGRLFLNSGGVKLETAATSVELTEHVFQWAYNTAPAKLFDNTNAYAEPADHETVKFSLPVKTSSVSAEGSLSIHELGENYAVVSGKGVLTGIPYVHLTRQLRKDRAVSSPGKVMRFSDCTLISAMNSENALERLYNFYTAAMEAGAELKVETERPGGSYAFDNSVGRRSRGVLSSMDFESGVNLKADCGFVTGYKPGPFGNNYNTVQLFTGSGTWTVPTALRQSAFPYIRVTLVGGGAGGEGGQGGQQGRGMWPIGGTEVRGRGSGPGGKGGRGGVAGTGGRVLTIAKLDVTNVARIYYSCGSGGSAGSGGRGGESSDVIVTTEEDTLPTAGGIGSDAQIVLKDDNGGTLGIYYSYDGSILPSGVANLASSEVYGLSGKDGYRGGNGGEGGTASASADGGNGEDITVDGITWPGGAGSLAFFDSAAVGADTMTAECGGGGGSGAAYGTPGNAAESDGHAQWQIWCEGGYGGHGVSSPYTPAAATTYGQGGDGGHGGSGGGSGGAQNNTPVQYRMQDGKPGNGGAGTDGAAGAPGCIFIYAGGAA